MDVVTLLIFNTGYFYEGAHVLILPDSKHLIESHALRITRDLKWVWAMAYDWMSHWMKVFDWLLFQYTTENAEDMYIYTQSRVCGGNFATQKVPVKETNGLKILNPFNFTGKFIIDLYCVLSRNKVVNIFVVRVSLSLSTRLWEIFWQIANPPMARCHELSPAIRLGGAKYSHIHPSHIHVSYSEWIIKYFLVENHVLAPAQTHLNHYIRHGKVCSRVKNPPWNNSCLSDTDQYM